MGAIPLCLLLNKPHLFSLTQVYFNSIGYPDQYATRFGLYSDHPQACQYKNLTKVWIHLRRPFLLPKDKTVPSDMGYRVAAISISRSCLNL
jgi:hypothetical protein